MKNHIAYHVIVIGGGAAGLMAAASAGQRGKKVLLLEHSNKIGEKIRISGGGRCNFTNLNIQSNNYISQNPHFIKSVLARYDQNDFIKLVEAYQIKYHEKTLGQLFCDGSSHQIINLLLAECKLGNVEIITECKITDVKKNDLFVLQTNLGTFECNSLIIATGGLSIPKIGATDFGYQIAKKFALNIIPVRPALVPLLTANAELTFCQALSGIAIETIVNYQKINFRENILFTHRGLSGPAILQISSYLPASYNQNIIINLLPAINLAEIFKLNKNSKLSLSNFLKSYLPNRFVEHWCKNEGNTKLIDYKMSELNEVANQLHNFKIHISGTEGYLKAEVTAGGIDTNELSSKTMEVNKVQGLYFIGEVVDITGWLGGYNFQWAWSSGFIAGQNA